LHPRFHGRPRDALRLSEFRSIPSQASYAATDGLVARQRLARCRQTSPAELRYLYGRQASRG